MLVMFGKSAQGAETIFSNRQPLASHGVHKVCREDWFFKLFCHSTLILSILYS